MDKNEIINKLNGCAESYAKALTTDIPEIVKQIKDYYQLDDDDIINIFGWNILNHLDICDTTVYELHDLAMLTLLSHGKFNIFNSAPNGKELNDVNQLMKEYNDIAHPVTKENKIEQLLKLFGVEDEAGLDRLLKAANDIRKKCCCDEKCTCDKSDTKYVNKDGNFTSKKEDVKEDEKVDTKVDGYIYDSETMDEPQSFTIDLNKLLGKNITFDKVMDFLRNFNKNLQ